MKRVLQLISLTLLLCIQPTLGVDRNNFRTCKDTGFCRRLRRTDGQQTSYTVSNVQMSVGSGLTADLNNDKGAGSGRSTLLLQLALITNDVIRLTINEKEAMHERWQVRDVLKPAALEVKEVIWLDEAEKVTASWSDGSLVMDKKPFKLEIKLGGKVAFVVNSNNLLDFEAYRPDRDAPDCDGCWAEKWKEHSDSKPRGPAGVSLDIAMASDEHYGIPEHASSFALKQTRGGGYDEPYRLFNLDVFEYDLDVPMALYGAVPFIMGHSAERTLGLFWANSAETFIDTWKGNGQTHSHWISESGIIDLFLIPGPTPAEVSRQHMTLTGMPYLPPKFGISYHQCRWNYKSEQDVAEVDKGFDTHDIPYDVLWLDIEHTKEKMYFTWDQANFPTPETMQKKIAEKKRKMVVIVDPHIKRKSGYQVHDKALSKDFYIHKSDKSTYEGWCWPGSVSYLDFLRPEVREYWHQQFQLDMYKGSTRDLFVWNDMNEPSVFNGPEVTMQKDNLHLMNTVEHRDVHNVYGYYHHMSTWQGLKKRDEELNVRPFVLTRSFFAGSQQYGAVWTGDNAAEWSHLKASVPMLLSLNVAGIVFSGADVGGFFGNPNAELLCRWYQVGAFQPFFRGHAHIDTTRREPWLFGEPWTSRIREAIRQRYKLLPYVYTLFFESNQQGTPIMRPLWWHFPGQSDLFTNEDSFMLGNSLLVTPVTGPGQTQTEVTFPGTTDTVWYNVVTKEKQIGATRQAITAPLEYIPVFQLGGTIIPQRWRARRNSQTMNNDPYTLLVALDSKGQANGELFLDDGLTYAFDSGAYSLMHYRFNHGILESVKAGGNGYHTENYVERVVFLGLGYVPSSIIAHMGSNASIKLEFVGDADVLTVRNPKLRINESWTFELFKN